MESPGCSAPLWRPIWAVRPGAANKVRNRSLTQTHARVRARPVLPRDSRVHHKHSAHLCPHSIRNHVDSKAGFTARPLPDRYSHCPVSRWGGVGMAGGRRGLVAPQNTFLENIVRRSNGKTSGLFYFTYEAYSFPFFKSSFPSPYRILKWRTLRDSGSFISLFYNILGASSGIKSK